VSTDYRDAIARAVRQGLKDPYSVRSAEIASTGFVGLLRCCMQPVVCYRFNSKNRFGAYVCIKTYAALFDRTRYAESVEAGLAPTIRTSRFPNLRSRPKCRACRAR
jgi:hypothetical protein